uniref:Uncharacterized protein n=1 Tax=Pundamilia nyererei TaxID=303518 RepID=A0A3B4ESE8_9CICH
ATETAIRINKLSQTEAEQIRMKVSATLPAKCCEGYLSNDFSVQYFDPEFQDYFTLHRTDQIKDKDTVKVVGIILSLTPSVVSSADSAATTSSQDTIILKRQKTTERCEPWPKQFPIPQFAYETEMYLERATEEYKKNEYLLPTSKVKTDILEKVAETIFTFTAYPSSAQVSYVAEALVKKYPCLKEPGSFSGYYGWQQSIKYKMANYHTKLRGFVVPELTCNAMKHKSPGDQKSAKKVKKPRKAEVNYLPPYPAGEDEDSQEEERIQLLTEVKKRDNNKVIKEKMAKTFAHRRHEIVNLSPSIEDIKARLPALFEASHVSSKFILGRLLCCCFFFLCNVSKNPVFLLFDGNGVSQDLFKQRMKIYKIKAVGSEEDDIGIVLEGVKVMPALGNFPRACTMLVGLTHCAKLSPKVNSLKNKLMA